MNALCSSITLHGNHCLLICIQLVISSYAFQGDSLLQLFHVLGTFYLDLVSSRCRQPTSQECIYPQFRPTCLNAQHLVVSVVRTAQVLDLRLWGSLPLQCGKADPIYPRQVRTHAHTLVHACGTGTCGSGAHMPCSFTFACLVLHARSQAVSRANSVAHAHVLHLPWLHAGLPWGVQGR